VRELLGETDSEAMHQMWLASDVAALFNEAISFPYTSLKYHTLLVAALLDNYLDGHAFADLSLVVDDAETIVPAGQSMRAQSSHSESTPLLRTGQPHTSVVDHDDRGHQRGANSPDIPLVPVTANST